MIQKSGRRTWRGLGVEALGRLLGRTGRVHSRTDERSREQSRRCALLLQLLLLLVQLLLRLRLPAALGNGRLKVFVTGQRQHVVTILLPVRQTSPDEILNKIKVTIPSTSQCNKRNTLASGLTVGLVGNCTSVALSIVFSSNMVACDWLCPKGFLPANIKHAS